MSLRIILVRHGETIWNQEGRSQGFSDIPLSAAGEAQAEALGRALAKTRLEAVYCSDLARARRTAESIAAPHRLLIRVDARLRELNQGALEGKDLKEMLACYPELLKTWMATPADVTMPGGESMHGLQSRCWRAIEELRQDYREGTVAVVTHNLAGKSIICKAIGLDLNLFRRLSLLNASISELEFRPHDATLIRLNDTAHL